MLQSVMCVGWACSAALFASCVVGSVELCSAPDTVSTPSNAALMVCSSTMRAFRCVLCNCIWLSSCHAGGGNIIGFSRGKTLKASALAKYGYNSPEAVAGLVRSGKVRHAIILLC